VRALILGEDHLCAVQGVAQRVPDGEHDNDHPAVADLDHSRIVRRAVLSGLINEYARAARSPEEPQVTAESYVRAAQPADVSSPLLLSTTPQMALAAA